MQIEGILAISSIVISGLIAGWKLIKKIRKSSCIIKTDNGTELEFKFDDIFARIDKHEEIEKMTPINRQKMKDVIKRVILASSTEMMKQQHQSHPQSLPQSKSQIETI